MQVKTNRNRMCMKTMIYRISGLLYYEPKPSVTCQATRTDPARHMAFRSVNHSLSQARLGTFEIVRNPSKHDLSHCPPNFAGPAFAGPAFAGPAFAGPFAQRKGTILWSGCLKSKPNPNQRSVAAVSRLPRPLISCIPTLFACCFCRQMTKK
jgi:hypothetical protein